MPRLETVQEAATFCLLILNGLSVLGFCKNSGEAPRVSGHISKGSIEKIFFEPESTPQNAPQRPNELSGISHTLLVNSEVLFKNFTSSNKKDLQRHNIGSKNVFTRSRFNSKVSLETSHVYLKHRIRTVSLLDITSLPNGLKEFLDTRSSPLGQFSIKTKPLKPLARQFQKQFLVHKLPNRKILSKRKIFQGHRSYPHYDLFVTSAQSTSSGKALNIRVKMKRDSSSRMDREILQQTRVDAKPKSVRRRGPNYDHGNGKNIMSPRRQDRLQMNKARNTYLQKRSIFSRRRKRNASETKDFQGLRTADSYIQEIINGLNVNYCSCMGGYARTTNGCTPVNTSVTIVDGSRYSPMIIESSLVEGSLRKVECVEGKAAVSLPRHSFALLPRGYLIVIPLGLYFTHDHYCMEHVLTQRRKTNASLPSNNLLVYSDVDEKRTINERTQYPDKEGEDAWDVQWRAKVCLKHPVKVCNRSGLSEFPSPKSYLTNTSQVEDRDLQMDVDIPTSLGKDIITWNYSELPSSLLTCPPGSSLETGIINSKNYLSYSRGGIVFSWNIKDNLYINLNHDQFCIDKGTVNSDEYVASFCHRETKVKKHNSHSELLWLQRKCCPSFQIFNVAINACEGSTHDESWIQKIYSSANRTNVQTSVSEKQRQIPNEQSITQRLMRPRVAWGFPDCTWQHSQYDLNDFRLEQHGGLVVNSTAVDWPYFCLETFRNKNSTPTLIHSIVYCLQSEAEDNSLTWDEILTMSLMGVSCVFMSLTLITYVCVPGVSDRIAGGCVVSEVASLLASFVLVIVAYLPHGLHGSIPCIVIGTIGHAVTLASFFWLNIICYDVHSTIRGTAMENRRFESRRYLAYCCWGWGAPCLIAAAGAAVDSFPAEWGLYRPHTARACFPSRDDSLSHWLYVYGPIAVLLTVNLCLFVHLSYTILRTTRQAMAMAKVSCDVDCVAAMRTRYRRRVLAYAKLFLVMGLSWIAELLSFQFHSHWAWIVTDSFNALRGVFIFFIFVYKPETWNKVKQTTSQKWRALRHRCSCSLRRKESTATAPAASAHSCGSASLSVLSSPHTPRIRRAARADIPNA